MSLAASAGWGPGAVWSPTHVQVTVLQARGLRAKGPGGTSDAYAVIQVGKEKYATSVSERSLGAPVWREEATFELPPLLSAEAAPAAAATLQLTVLHRALLGLDKFLGRAEVDLRRLHQDQGRRRTQWYTLKSKPGKKDKERGEIEVDIQFMRNNMTASMFDLSMKDKSRNPFGKLKDKIKGKNKDSASDTVSAIVPRATPSADSDDESPSKDKKKKSKIKTLFSKSNLQRTPLSQSMSILPTSKSDKVMLRPGDFESRWGDDDEDESSSASDVLSHKRTASADPKQLNQVNFSLPKKEGLSFLGGLRSKNDVLSRSNVCINGNHVYAEPPEAKTETKDSSPSPSPSPQGLRKKRWFSSTENLASRPWREPGEGGAVPPESSTKDALKSMSLPNYQPQVSRDLRENAAPATLEAAKETKDSKKQENKKSALLFLVPGKKDTAKGSESESPPAATASGKEREGAPAALRAREHQPGPADDLVKRSDKEASPVASELGRALNPFEDRQLPEPEADPEPKTAPVPPVLSPRAPQTRAVKPRPEASPEAPPAPRHPPSTNSPLFLSALPSGSGQIPVSSKPGHDSETPSSESPSGSSSVSSPLAAPISTSTPIKNWPSADPGQASSEEPPSLLELELEKETRTRVPNTDPHTAGLLSKQTPVPVTAGREDYSPRKTSTNDPAQSLRTQPEEGQEGGLLGSPWQEQQGDIAPSDEAREVASALAPGRGRRGSPPGKPPGREDADSAGDAGGSGRLSPAAKEMAPPLHTGESAPTPNSAMTPGHEEMGPDARDGGKDTKKQAFSKQLSAEEAGAESPRLVHGDRGAPQEPTPPGDTPRNAMDMGDSQEGVAVTGPRPAALAAHTPRPSSKGSFSGGPQRATGSGRDGPLFRSQGDDTRMAWNQSKASDHEGLLSDPLRGLQAPCEAKPPGAAHLDLTLPSIPEVESDDERGDQPEDGGGAALVAGGGGRAPSSNAGPVQPERARAPSEEAGGSAAGSLCDPVPGVPKAPTLAFAEQTPGPGGDGGKAGPAGDGSLPRPPAAALGPPVSSSPSPPLLPATRSFPCSAHSDTPHTNTAESQKKATAEGSAGNVDNPGKRKPLLQARVSPSETQPSAGSRLAKHRLHPVKPMNTTAPKVTNSTLGTAVIVSENLINEAGMKKYKPSDPAFAYAQLTHDELIQLVLKQKETISKKECQVRQLEDYIDNLLVRVMEETPNILRVPSQAGKKAGKM
ncbi:rab11 family-interacting protein 1 [Moschus berezovskii]|uniref:rab11 family-interacting protein 1 n=1 Tax=Moschus berezovskii TaxID=68408 RepID=UPI0024443E4A|nr:rab11 family-interacting protein 1 [Moschus berezovskii]